MTTCTRCEGTGFLNLEQAPDEIANGDCEIILGWIVGKGAGSDVQVCDCCGNFFVLSARYFPLQLADGNSNSSNAKQLKQWLSGTPGYAVLLGGAA